MNGLIAALAAAEAAQRPVRSVSRDYDGVLSFDSNLSPPGLPQLSQVTERWCTPIDRQTQPALKSSQMSALSAMYQSPNERRSLHENCPDPLFYRCTLGLGGGAEATREEMDW